MREESVFLRLSQFFREERIEYFSALEFSRCEIINPKRLPDFDIKSVIVFLMPYYTGTHPDRNVSLYSISRDYHLYAKELDVHLKERLKDSGIKTALYSDSSPINERKLALKAGLGVLGDNGLLINEKYGSYVFIGCIFTDTLFGEHEYTTEYKEKTCTKCGRCKRVCGFLDGREEVCFSALTQKKNVTNEELALIRSRKIRWGCDICQEVCPMNEGVCLTPIEFFYEDVVERLDIKLLEEMSEEDFAQRAYSWRGRDVIKRNFGE